MKTSIIIFLALCFSNVSICQNRVAIGSVATEITITDYLLNVPKDIKFRDKYVLLEFWATWCSPCLQAVPKLNKLQEKYKNRKDFVFISMTDEKPEKAVRVFDKIPFKTIVVSDQNRNTYKDYIDNSGGYSIPVTVLIDNKNIVKWIGHPDDINELMLDKFLKNEKIAEDEISSPSKATVSKKKVPDSNLSYLSSSMDDKDTQFLFSIITGKRGGKNIAFSSLGNQKSTKGMYVNTNSDLTSIISQLLNVNTRQIYIPEKFKDSTYSIFYKNTDLKDGRENKVFFRRNDYEKI